MNRLSSEICNFISNTLESGAEWKITKCVNIKGFQGRWFVLGVNIQYSDSHNAKAFDEFSFTVYRIGIVWFSHGSKHDILYRTK